MGKLSPEIDALLRGYDANYDRPASVDLSHPVMREFYEKFVEPKIAALVGGVGSPPEGGVVENDDPVTPANDKTEEYLHPEIYHDAVINGLNQLASKAALANNEKAAYLIELAAAEIKSFSEE